jgi:hypothetical protein
MRKSEKEGEGPVPWGQRPELRIQPRTPGAVRPGLCALTFHQKLGILCVSVCLSIISLCIFKTCSHCVAQSGLEVDIVGLQVCSTTPGPSLYLCISTSAYLSTYLSVSVCLSICLHTWG